MHIEEVRWFCLSFKGVSEGFPFDSETLVFKVMGKMFCLMGLDNGVIALKNQPEKVAQFLSDYTFVAPAYHMNKKHWIQADIMLSPELFLKQWITESYDLVVAGLTAAHREELNKMDSQ